MAGPNDPYAPAGGSNSQLAWRWDHSVALALIVVGALALLGIIHVNFSPTVRASAGIGR